MSSPRFLLLPDAPCGRFEQSRCDIQFFSAVLPASPSTQNPQVLAGFEEGQTVTVSEPVGNKGVGTTRRNDFSG